VAAVSMVLLRHAHDHYRRSGLYGGDPVADPEAVSEEPDAPVNPPAAPGRLPAPADVSATQDPPAPYPEP
jgi:hypothetical protein